MNETVIPALPTVNEDALTAQITQAVFCAMDISIESKSDYEMAARLGVSLKEKENEVKEFFEPLKKNAHRLHKDICGKEKAMLAPLVTAEKLLTDSMAAWIEKERLAQKMELDRAKAEAEEGIELMVNNAVEFEKNGDVINAEAALYEAEMVENLISQQESAMLEKQKTSGVVERTDFEITDIRNSEVPTTFNGVEIRPVDLKAVMKMIRDSKGTIEIPGISYKKVTKMNFKRVSK